ncbi:MAG: hypothetical protein ACLFTT_17585, partial [Candidatus Hydrogenedentota bacterium]
NEVATAREEQERLTNELATAQEDKERLANELATAQEVCDTLTQEVETLRAAVEAAETAPREEAEDAAELAEQVQCLYDEIDEVAQAHARERLVWEESRANLEAELAAARDEIARVTSVHQREKETWRQTKRALAERLRRILGDASGPVQDNDTMATGLRGLHDEIAHNEPELTEIKQLGMSIQQELDLTRRELARLKDFFVSIENRWSSQATSRE